MEKNTSTVKPENNTDIIANEDKSEDNKVQNKTVENADPTLNGFDKESRDYYVDQNVDLDKQSVNLKGYKVGNPNPADHPKEDYHVKDTDKEIATDEPFAKMTIDNAKKLKENTGFEQDIDGFEKTKSGDYKVSNNRKDVNDPSRLDEK